MDYTQYDYNALVDHITTKLKETQGWGNAYNSSTGQQLIQLIANEVDQLHYMLERRSREMYLDTARLESSIIARASEVGYRSRRRIGARGTLTLNLTDENGNPKPAEGMVTIDGGTSVYYDDIEFIVEEATYINAGETSTNIEVVQGVITDFQFDPNADGGDNNLTNFNFVVIENPFIYDDRYIQVFDSSYTYVDVTEGAQGMPAIGAVSFAAKGQPYYDIRYPADGMRVIFGDDISGVQPASPVTVRLLETQGEQVDIQSTVSFKFDVETLGDNVVTTPLNEYYYTMTNSTPVDDGQAAETLEQVRNNAVSFVRTNNRAVTREDYRYWTLQAGIGGIVDAEAFGEQELSTLIYNANNVYISYLTDDGNELTVAEQKDMLDYMRELTNVTTHTILRPVEIVYMRYAIDFKRDSRLGISNSELHDVIRRTMDDIFELEQGSIGRGFQQSDIINEFYNTTLLRGGTTYNIVDFMRLQMWGLYPVSVPYQTNRAVISMDPVSPTGGEQFVVVIDGETFTVTAEATDTNETLISKMRDKVYYSTDYTVRLDQNIMRVTSTDRTKLFGVDVSQGNFTNEVILEYIVRVPPKSFQNTGGSDMFLGGSVNVDFSSAGTEPLFLAGSFQIIDATDGTVYFEDDGNGSLDPVSGGTYDGALSGAVDYTTGDVSMPNLSAGDYYIQFKQDQFDNFQANNETAFDVISAKTSYTDVTETLSTITIV